MRWSLLALPIVLLLGCDDDEQAAQVPTESLVIEGESQQLFGATLESWVRLDAQGRVIEVGFTMPEAAIEAAPTQSPSPVFVILELPEEARAQTAIDHIEVDWEPTGHEPPVFQVPHFDLHYSMIPTSEVAAIDCTDRTAPRADRVPEGYLFAPPGQPIVCVPHMGYHAFAESALEQPFDATMVLGYYSGRLIFIEPMVTQQTLLAQKSFELGVPVPEVIDTVDGRTFPTRFQATWDGEAKAYDLALTTFVPVQ